MDDAITIKLEAFQLAEDINRDATPKFRITLIRELFRLDPALRAEVLGE